MPTIIKRKSPTTGTISFLAQVRVKNFKPAAKTFRVETTAKAARQRAIDWGEALEKELQQQAGRSETRPDVTQLTIGHLIKEFLAEPEVMKLRSFTDVDRLLGWWVLNYATTRVLDFGVVTLRAARNQLLKGRGPATVNRHLSQLRSAWNWGIVSGLVPQERAWPKRLLLKEPRGRVRFLSDAEINAVLKAAEADAVMRAALVVSLGAGLRQGELLRLTWADVDLAGAKVTVRESKNDERRAMYLPPEAVEALTKLRKAKIMSPLHVFVLSNGKPLKKSLLESRWRTIRAAAKLHDFRWHDLRHTCASVLLQNGATLAQIGSVLGHKSPGMTQRYSHLVQGAAVTGHDKLDEKLKGKPV